MLDRAVIKNSPQMYVRSTTVQAVTALTLNLVPGLFHIDVISLTATGLHLWQARSVVLP
jgi:hypothetical protein